MKIAGIILFLIGTIIFLIGVVICIVTLTDDYATETCRKAAVDERAIDEARAVCKLDNDCFRRRSSLLTTKEECESRKSFMNRQLIMGIVPAILGGLIGFVGLLLTIFGFVRSRRNRSGPGLA